MPTGNDQYRVNQILRVAKLYYELHLSQIEIARREHLSKSTVSRLIKAALDMGMVQIAIVEPKHSFTAVEDALTARFGLKKATVLPDVVGNRDILRRDICAALAEDLGRVVANGSVVGVAWGNTMSTLGKVLSKTDRQGVSVIQLNGGLSKALYETGTAAVVRDFVDALNAEGYLLPAPALVDTPAIADAIKSDSSVNRILTLAARCDVAVYSVGAMGQGTALYQMGYFAPAAYDRLCRRAVGDICSHFVDAASQVADRALDARVVATPLATIQRIPSKLVVAAGTEKAAAVLACLRGGMADYLYIDKPLAAEILRLDAAKNNQKTKKRR